MSKKIKSFIRTGLIITTLVFGCISFTPKDTMAFCDHTYVKVMAIDGTLWIYEYDCDGRLIDVYPALD